MKKSLIVLGIAVSAWAEDITPLKTVEVPLKILTDSQGMTAYVFDKDTQGIPTCYDECAVHWPHIPAPEGEVQLPLSVVVRRDGVRQLAFKGRPIYTFFQDRQPKDILGDGLKGIWHVVHP